MATINESAMGDYVVDESGIQTSRNFSVLAYSADHALTLLRTGRGVEIGATLRTIQGEKPDESVICRRLVATPRREAAPGQEGLYDIVAEYRREEQEPVPGGPAKYRIKGQMSSRPVDTDANGQPIMTSSEEPIDPPLTLLEPGESVEVSWYTQASDQITLQKALRPYRGATNAVAWLGAIADSFLCHGVEIGEELPDAWWLLRGTFEYREPIDPAAMPDISIRYRTATGTLASLSSAVGGWWGQYADRGRRVKGTTDTVQEWEQVLDESGQPLSDPVMLDGAGSRLEVGYPPVMIVVPLYRKRATFQNLGI